MKKIFILLPIFFLYMNFTCFSFAQSEEKELFWGKSIKLGLGYEYFSRSITWDDDKYDSSLKSHFFTFNTELEILQGLTLNALIGYSSSNYDSLVFRKPPLSIDLGVGGLGGLLLGGAIKKSLIHVESLEIDAYGQFFYYSGTQKEWDIPESELNVSGSIEGDPTWSRFSIGPVFTYKKFSNLFPYLSFGYNRLWGVFKMDQTIQALTGSEEKKISGKGSFITSLGFIYDLLGDFNLKAEVYFLPSKNKIDLGFKIKTLYSF